MAKKPVKKAAKKAPVKKKKAPVKKKSKPRRPLMVMDLKEIAPKDYLKITQIDDETDSMAEALGITEERHKQLADAAVAAYKATHKFSAAMEMASRECKHANELGYTMYLLGDIRAHVQNPLGGIMQIIMGGRPKG
jgi:hypothetical protein